MDEHVINNKWGRWPGNDDERNNEMKRIMMEKRKKNKHITVMDENSEKVECWLKTNGAKSDEKLGE